MPQATVQPRSFTVPYHLEIRTLHHPVLRLIEPISVVIIQERQQVVAYAPDIEMYGYGEDLADALSDLREAIVDLYFDLQAQSGSLGRSLERIWAYLRSVIEESDVGRRNPEALPKT